MAVFVGLDCGGSSSRVLAVGSEPDDILYQGQSGAANLVSTPESRIRRNLTHAIKDCPQPDYVCGCFAGLINEQIRDKAIGLLREFFPEAELRAEPDYTAALYAAPGTDLCVIAGTGSLVCSRANGKIVKSGGRGYILGDEGSGYYFGRDALVQFLNRRSEASPYLVNTVQEVFGSLDEPDIVAAVYRGPSPATVLAKLARAVGNDAAMGHDYALQSIERNMDALAKVIVGHILQFHTDQQEVRITLSGGVWKAGNHFKITLEEKLAEYLPKRELHISKLTKPPLRGAVELAREMNHGN